MEYTDIPLPHWEVDTNTALDLYHWNHIAKVKIKEITINHKKGTANVRLDPLDCIVMWRLELKEVYNDN